MPHFVAAFVHPYHSNAKVVVWAMEYRGPYRMGAQYEYVSRTEIHPL